jgi:recombinational DNA repair ATPase RecF
MNLLLHNWRCFEQSEFELPQTGFAICDQNGMGKTSVLSGIYSLYTTLPWSDQSLKNCIKHHQNYFGLKNQEIAFSGQIEPSGRLKTKSEILVEELQKPLILSYSPNDNLLLSLTRTKKLNFIDQILSQILPSYLPNLKIINKLFTHKQAIIKGVLEDNQELDQTLLHTTNQSIWNFSWYFWEERAKFLNFLNNHLPEAEKWLNLKFFDLSLKYFTTLENINRSKFDFQNLEKQFLQAKTQDSKHILSQIWSKELSSGRCLWGSNRDDFEIYLGDENVIEILSRGQMRLLILWLKYLGLRYAREELKLNMPVWWLLDDAFNELDNTREQILVQEILSKVDWFVITSTEKSKICESYSLGGLQAKY